MNSLLHYLRYFVLISKMSFNSMVIYRVDFIIRIFRAFLEIAITLIVINSVFNHNQTLGNWSQLETTLVASTSLLIISMVYLVFGHGAEGLHRQIVNGQLDRILVQPLDAQWLASTGFIYITNIFRLLFNLILFFSLLSQLNYSITQFFWFLTSFISSFAIYYSLIFSGAIISFWALSGELFYLLNSLSNLAKFPMDIFSQLTKIFFTVIPVIFIATVPAQALLGRNNILVYISPIVAIICLYLTRRFWFIGLHTYDSASS